MIVAAQEGPATWLSKVVSVQGDVVARRNGAADWQPVKLNETFSAGDQIHVGANSRAGVVLSNDAMLRLDQNTRLTFTAIEQQKTFLLNLLQGAANFFSHRARSLKILTPFVNGVVEGTEFFVQVDEWQTRIDLFAGRIRAENAHGTLHLVQGEGAVAQAGSAPRRYILIRPRDSVQWAMYYPPVLVMDTDIQPAAMREVVKKANAGPLAEALARLDAMASDARSVPFFIARASLRLHVGRIDGARDDLREALALDPGNGNALALQAVIDVVQTRPGDALKTARQAVDNAPRSATARLALSYALQAGFHLDAALKEAQMAVTDAPKAGLAWARLAELHLSMGELKDGVRAARRAVDLEPQNAHAYTTLGFAHLTRIQTDHAREAFAQAITLDSAAPLPRLGIGLARIRDGDLEGGRREIEIAAGLDPQNALIRSYLGKAYFDEKRGPLDGEQFDIAKSLDPNDPTPWFYDAIRKQTLNRPVEALQDLQTSIALNDNRAVYRSRLMLDEDLAARSASLGRIYQDLSFESQAVAQGAASLRADPTSFSAHRLLSDIFAGRRRHEIARVSEMLQAQLLQPLNPMPIQPESTESTLIAPESAGAQWASWNEFNPLFTRDRTTYQAAGMAGSNNTWSDALSVAGLSGRYAYSLGQYHYESDGFRPNNDLEKDIADAFLQTALTPGTSIQFEYRYREVEHGDLTLNFDPDDYWDTQQVSRREKIPRLGLHHAIDARHHFIGSLILNQTDYRTSQQIQSRVPGFGPIVAVDDLEERIDAYNAEGQYIWRGQALQLIAGAGYYHAESDEGSQTGIFSGNFRLYGADSDENSETRHGNGYTYAYLTPMDRFDITLGLSADTLTEGEVEQRQVNPKIGLVWSPTTTLTLRGAAFRTLKRSLVSNQTLEPTQLAGFTQFFDDYLATDARRYGLGVDSRILQNLWWGGELTFADLEYPTEETSTGAILEEQADEYHHRVYLNWLAHPHLAIAAEYFFDFYKVHADEREDMVRELETQTLPLTLTCFLPSSFQTRIRGTWVCQRVEQIVLSSMPIETHHENFFLTDIMLGYRLPNRRGMVSLGVSNLFDTNFNYQDTNFLTANDQDPIYKPERQLFFRVALTF